MKTTVDLPDHLLIAAKKRAAETRRSLRGLIEEGLRSVLSERKRGEQRRKPRIRWVVARGGTPPDLDLGDREAMHEWLRARR